MSTHSFRLGDLVALRFDAREPEKAYEITRLLPLEGGEPEYRIKSIGEPFERVVREHQLQPLKVAAHLRPATPPKPMPN